MATKRSPEQGSSGQESVFEKNTAKRLGELEVEINTSSIDQGKKDHLLGVINAIRNDLSAYAIATNKKESKDSLHFRIVSLEEEFKGFKNTKRKTKASEYLKTPEAMGKKDREIDRDKLLADLEEARLYLVGQSTTTDNVIFKNFGKYKKVQGEIRALVEVTDKADYDAKKLKIDEQINALLDIKKGEPKVEAVLPVEEAKVLDATQQLPEEPEEDKPAHKAKKASPRKPVEDAKELAANEVINPVIKADVSADDQEWKKERGPKLEDAKARARLLRRVMAKMLTREQKYELRPFVRPIDNSLDLAAGDGAKFANVFEEQMNRFEHSFKNLLSKVGDEAVAEFESQKNGNPPSWEKESAKVPEPDKEPVSVAVEKDKKEEMGEAPRELSVDEREEREQWLEDADKRWKLLRSVVMEKMTEEERVETKENEEKIESSLEKIKKTDHWDEYRKQIKVFEHNFAGVWLGVSEEVRREYKRQEASLGKEEKKEDVPVVEKDKKEEMGEAPRELSVDEREERDQKVEEARKEWRKFESVVKHNITKSEWADLSAHIEIIKSSLSEAGNTKFFDEYKAQMKRFDNIYSKLLHKIPEELRRRIENAEAPDRAKNLDKKDSKDQEKESEIKERKKRVIIVGRIMRGIFESQDKNYNFNETRTAVLAHAAILELDNAKMYLENKNLDEYEKSIDSASELTKDLWTSIPNNLKENVRKEFDLTVAGKVTLRIKQESQDYDKKIQEQESNLALLEQIMDEQDKSLRTEFAPELKAVREALSEAYGVLGAGTEEFYEENLDNMMRAFGKLSLPPELKEVKNKFWSKKAGIDKQSQSGSIETDVPTSTSKIPDAEVLPSVILAPELPSPDQQVRLQMYERDFGVLEKMVENSGDKSIIDGFKWRMEVIRTNIDKAKKEMNQHNKLDETVLYNMQALAEDLQKHYPKLHAEFMQKISPPVAPAPEKKGFFARAKDKVLGFGKAVFNKEVGKTAGKAVYDTVTTLFGVKIITDIARAGLTGKGDFAEWREGSKESKEAIGNITAAYEDLLASSEKTKKGEALSENERIEKRIEFLKEKIGGANIQEEAKKQIIERLWAISIKHQENTEKSKKERDQEVKELLESYIHSKVSGVKIAKDALNGLLTITGFSLLRGAMYLGVSAFEKMKQARKEETKDIAGSLADKKDFRAKANEVIANTAKETARSLMGRGAKEGASGVTRAVDFIKALGVIARGVGIFNITVLHGDSPKESIDNLIQAIKEQDASIISDSFVQNAKRVVANMENVGHAVVNPIDTAENAWDKVTGQTGTLEVNTPKPVAELPEEKAVVPNVETVVESIPEAAPFSVQDFAAENKLSEESLVPLQELVKQYPNLNNQESLSRILDASKVGDGVKFHHADIVRGDVDTLIEAEGERRSVIFEELVKAKDYEGAAKYLEGQGFGSMHKSYIADYIGKGTHEDYLKFVAQYDEKPDKKMVYGLFRAMQGKGNTELANAGFFKAATENTPGRTVSLQGGELEYFGLNEKGEPILSGQGRVVLKETILAKITTSPTTISEVRVTDMPSVDDRLRLNADEMRIMKDELPRHDETENALPVHMKDGAERAVLADVEADKARFAKLGEEHVDVLKRVRAGEPVGAYASGVAQHEAGQVAIQSENQNDGVQVVGEETTTEKTLVGKTMKTYTASGEVVQPSAGAVQPESKVSVGNSGSKVSVLDAKPVANIVEEPAKELPKAGIIEQAAEAEKIENLKLMYENFGSMREYVVMQKMNFIIVGDGHDILNKQIRNEPSMRNFREYAKDAISGNVSNVDDKTIKSIEVVKQTLDSFNHMDKNPDWYKMLKGEELKLFLDPNKDNSSMLANDSHMARITDKEGKEFLISDSDNTFVVKDGALLKMDEGKIVQKYSYEEAISLANDMLKNEPVAATK